MAKLKAEIIRVKDKARWNELLYSSLYPSYRQSFEYERSKTIHGREVTTFVFSLNNKDIAGVHYSIKKSKYNLLITADILTGFVFKETPTKKLLEDLLNHFTSFAKKNNASFLHFSPWLPDTIRQQKTEFYSIFNSVLSENGWEIANKGKHTYWIDLLKGKDELLKQMKRQTRYDVRQGIKSEIKTEVYSEINDEHIEDFWQHYKLLGERKQFSMYTEQSFKNEVATLVNSGAANLFVAKFNNTTVNYSVASNFGVASYLHGAINPNFKALKGCPSPGPLAQWEMISYVKQKDATIYDMGFCPGPVPDKSHPSYQIWRFKYGFGGYHVQFLPTYGKIINPVRGRIFRYLKYKNK